MAGTTITGTISTGLTLHGTLGASQDTPTGTVVTGSSIDGQMVGGPKGEAATVTVGTVTTGAPSSVTNSGSSSAAVLDFVLEQGATGDTGPANTLAIGTVTSGPTADATITGTAPNQTLSLTLPKGDTGAQGLQGVKGDTGEQGPQGIQGSTGPIGLTGLTGSTGATGAKGDKGDKGDDGDPGPPNTLTAGTVAQIPAGGQPTFSVTGTAPNQTLNLGLVDGSPTAFELRGEGFPGTGTNATATNAAAVGTYYTDTLGTNGAWRWLKTSAGTGTERWAVMYGDTGWRSVVSSIVNGWTANLIHVRRINDRVLWRVFQLDNSAQTNSTFIVPAPGFGAGASALSIAVWTDTGAGQVLTGNTYVKAYAKIGAGNYVNFEHTTPSAWPSTLPGTPA